MRGFRSSRGVTLTEAGKKALRYAEIMSDAADGLRSMSSIMICRPKAPSRCAPGMALRHTGSRRTCRSFICKPEDRIAPGHHGPARIQTCSTKNPDIAIQFSEPLRQEIVSKKLGILHYVFFASAGLYLETFGHPVSSTCTITAASSIPAM